MFGGFDIMKILITAPQGDTFDRHFPPQMLDRLRALGELTINPNRRQYTRDELKELLADVDIILTHWGMMQLDAELLDRAPRLKLLAHCAGTVAHIASEECYIHGIPVLSANPIMAKYVAEWVLGAMIAGLRQFVWYDNGMRDGKWLRNPAAAGSLFQNRVGLIGLGTVGRRLLELLRPFGCEVCVYDPYIPESALDEYEFAHISGFEDAMSCPVVSIHASQTPETYHIINADALRLIPDDGLLINSSRGSLVDTEAAIAELETGRIRMVFDVYEHEGRAQDSRLLDCRDNTILLPHTAGNPAGSSMTAGIIDDIERFIKGEAMKLIVSHEQYLHMTQE